MNIPDLRLALTKTLPFQSLFLHEYVLAHILRSRKRKIEILYASELSAINLLFIL